MGRFPFDTRAYSTEPHYVASEPHYAMRTSSLCMAWKQLLWIMARMPDWV